MSEPEPLCDNRDMIAISLFAIWLQAGAATSMPQAATPADPSTIRNFLRVSTDFCTGGQPRPEHFARLKADGVKTVVNLRTPGEHRADEERQAVEQAGLKVLQHSGRVHRSEVRAGRRVPEDH